MQPQLIDHIADMTPDDLRIHLRNAYATPTATLAHNLPTAIFLQPAPLLPETRRRKIDSSVLTPPLKTDSVVRFGKMLDA